MTDDEQHLYVRIHRRSPESKARYIVEQLAAIDLPAVEPVGRRLPAEWVKLHALWFAARMAVDEANSSASFEREQHHD